MSLQLTLCVSVGLHLLTIHWLRGGCHSFPMRSYLPIMPLIIPNSTGIYLIDASVKKASRDSVISPPRHAHVMFVTTNTLIVPILLLK